MRSGPRRPSGACAAAVLLSVAVGLAGCGSAAQGASSGSNSSMTLSSTSDASGTSTDSFTSSDSSSSVGPASFCDSHSCIPNFDAGTGYIVQCADGMWSHSGGRSGACSYHGGETSVTAQDPSGGATPTPPSTTTTTVSAVPSVPSAPTGTDSSGYNTGSGCSDNPASTLPGCSDAPSVPSGDTSASCANGLTVDARTTSCPLAQSVRSAYTTDGPVTVSSNVFDCKTGGTGTTGFTICTAPTESGTILYVRWHK